MSSVKISQNIAFGCVGSTIRLESGIYLDLQQPRPEQIRLDDIAGSLSRICRFGGHVGQFYSVAEHCWHCADQARWDGLGLDVQRWALMHDAAEAYIGDVVKPLKELIKPLYGPIEARIEAVIAARFGLALSVEAVSAVKEIDNAMLIAERRALFTRDDTLWVGEETVRHLPRVFWLHSSSKAEVAFLRRAEDLGLV
jgi:hypothetical protein